MWQPQMLYFNTGYSTVPLRLLESSPIIQNTLPAFSFFYGLALLSVKAIHTEELEALKVMVSTL